MSVEEVAATGGVERAQSRCSEQEGDGDGEGDGGGTDTGKRTRQRCPFNWAYVEERAVVEAGFALYERHPAEVHSTERQGFVVMEEYKAAVEALTEEWKRAVVMAKHLRQRPVPSQEDSIEWRCAPGGRVKVRRHGFRILDRFRGIASEVLTHFKPLLQGHPAVLPPSQAGGAETLRDGSTDWAPVLADLKRSFYLTVKSRRDPGEIPPNWEDARWYAFETHGPHVTGRALADQFNLSRLAKLVAGAAPSDAPTPAPPHRRKPVANPTPAQPIVSPLPVTSFPFVALTAPGPPTTAAASAAPDPTTTAAHQSILTAAALTAAGANVFPTTPAVSLPPTTAVVAPNTTAAAHGLHPTAAPTPTLTAAAPTPSSARQPATSQATAAQQEKALARVLLDQQAVQKRQASVLEAVCERRFFEGQLATLRAQTEVLGLLAKQAADLDDKAEQRQCMHDLRAVHESMGVLQKEAAEAETKRKERGEEAAREQEAGRGLMAMRKRIRLAGGVSAVPLQPSTQGAELCIHTTPPI